MGLDSIVRSGIKTIDRITKSLQATVTLKRWTGADIYGSPTYAAPISIQAVVDQTQEMRKTDSGQMIMTTAEIMFIQAIPPQGAPGRVEPIDPRDIITLPDGKVGGPIVYATGLVDRVSKRPYYGEVWLG